MPWARKRKDGRSSDVGWLRRRTRDQAAAPQARLVLWPKKIFRPGARGVPAVRRRPQGSHTAARRALSRGMPSFPGGKPITSKQFLAICVQKLFSQSKKLEWLDWQDEEAESRTKIEAVVFPQGLMLIAADYDAAVYLNDEFRATLTERLIARLSDYQEEQEAWWNEYHRLLNLFEDSLGPRIKHTDNEDELAARIKFVMDNDLPELIQYHNAADFVAEEQFLDTLSQYLRDYASNHAASAAASSDEEDEDD